MKKNIDLTKLLISIAIPILIGMISSLISKGHYENYNYLAKPELSPPSYVFGIVWTILYILMGISFYIVSQTKDKENKKSINFIYYLQLFFNFMWSIIFFKYEMYFLSFIWILILIVLVIFMITKFYDINKKAGILNIPYLLWLSFAAYLNFMIFILN